MVKINAKKEALPANNRAELEQDIEWSGKDTAYKPLLQVIADIIDLSASGQDAYLSLGCTRDRSAIVLMVSIDGNRQSVYSDTLRHLDEQAESLL